MLAVCAVGQTSASSTDLSCQALPLSDRELRDIVGLPASRLQALQPDERTCLYRRTDDAFIRLHLDAIGSFADDEYDAQKEQDTAKPTEEFPAPLPLAGLGADAYGLGRSPHRIVRVLDRFKAHAFTVEIQDMPEAAATAEALARTVESHFAENAGQRPHTNAPLTTACEMLLSASDIQNLTGLPAAQYDLRRTEADGCTYRATLPGDLQRILQVTPFKLSNKREANALLTSLQNQTLGKMSPPIGLAAGILPSRAVWFVSSNTKWIILVSFYEIAPGGPSAATGLSLSEQNDIRNAIARTIDKTVSMLPRL